MTITYTALNDGRILAEVTEDHYTTVSRETARNDAHVVVRKGTSFILRPCTIGYKPIEEPIEHPPYYYVGKVASELVGGGFDNEGQGDRIVKTFAPYGYELYGVVDPVNNVKHRAHVVRANVHDRIARGTDLSTEEVLRTVDRLLAAIELL